MNTRAVIHRATLLIGVGLIVAGVAMIWIPAALIAAGAGLGTLALVALDGER